jgi:hypothetical protein
MEKNESDKIVIDALFKRFTEQRLPRALDIEKRVNAGEILNHSDLTFLDVVLDDAKYVLQYSDKYPDYQEIVRKAIQMYSEISQKALENEKNNQKK